MNCCGNSAFFSRNCSAFTSLSNRNFETSIIFGTLQATFDVLDEQARATSYGSRESGTPCAPQPQGREARWSSPMNAVRCKPTSRHAHPCCTRRSMSLLSCLLRLSPQTRRVGPVTTNEAHQLRGTPPQVLERRIDSGVHCRQSRGVLS